jgi:hypothetical protein
MSYLKRIIAGLALTFMVGLTMPAQAQCFTFDAPDDQTYTCNDDIDGVNVGAGNDDVNIVGEVNGTIQSSGGRLRVFVITPMGLLDVTGSDAIVMNGNGDIEVEGDVTSTENGIFLNGNGSVSSIGTINAGDGGIYIDGNGNIVNEGDINAVYYGLRLTGSGSIFNTGDLTTSDFSGIGINALGEAHIINHGDITANNSAVRMGDGTLINSGLINVAGGHALWVMGDGTLINSGEVHASHIGLYMSGSGSIINSGEVYADSVAIRLNEGGFINNSGFIIGNQGGIILDVGGTVINSGGIQTAGEAGIFATTNGNIINLHTVLSTQNGIVISNDGNITNTGYVAANLIGLNIGGDGNIRHSGEISSQDRGIELNGNGVIEVEGLVEANNIGVVGGSGNQLVVIDAVVTGDSGTAVSLNDGADRLRLNDDADVQGNIDMGAGNDTVQIGTGAQVNGLIDGGDDEDTLIVGDEELCKEASGSLDRVSQNSAFVGSINLSGDTFEYEGESYEIANFENGANGITRRTCVPKIEDGRINAYDIGAWVAGYCNTQDGLNLWPIDLEGRGQVDLSVDGATMRAALEQAVNGGANVQIASGPRGTSLWALASNQYQFMRADQREPWKNYVYIFPPGTCGMGNSLEG